MKKCCVNSEYQHKDRHKAIISILQTTSNEHTSVSDNGIHSLTDSDYIAVEKDVRYSDSIS